MRPSSDPSPSVSATYTQLTFTGDAKNPLISPDGQFVAYTRDTGTEMEFLVRDIGGGEPGAEGRRDRRAWLEVRVAQDVVEHEQHRRSRHVAVLVERGRRRRELLLIQVERRRVGLEDLAAARVEDPVLEL